MRNQLVGMVQKLLEIDPAVAMDQEELNRINAIIDETEEAITIPDNAFLMEVDQIVKERGKKYDPPRVNFRRIAEGWAIILGIPVTERQVALMMIWTKVCRDVAHSQPDNIKDIAGYAVTAAMLDDYDGS